jgi:hypothetical protein
MYALIVFVYTRLYNNGPKVLDITQSSVGVSIGTKRHTGISLSPLDRLLETNPYFQRIIVTSHLN